jgi:Family of unknown function (DUF5723)
MKVFYYLLLLICPAVSIAQNYAGYRSGNYTGVNGVFFNPANIADSRYRFDVNLASVSVGVSNDQASFNIKELGKTFDSDSLKNKFFGKDAGASSGLVNADVFGPSCMFNASKKMSFAVTTRSRIMGNVSEFDGKLIQKITDDFTNDPSLPYTIASLNNMKLNVHAWSEFGLSVARIISNQKVHFVKGGLSLKYLAGAGNSYINLGNFKGTINQDLIAQDAYLNNSTGAIAMGFGGIDVDNFKLSQLTKTKSSGVGADIGFVYEFRPAYEKYQLDSNTWRSDVNKYKIKVGVALLDVGTIKYKKDNTKSGSYNIDITGNERMYLKELGDKDLAEFKKYFDSKPQFFTPAAINSASSYKVNLPTRLQVEVDYNIYKNFYVNAEGVVAIGNNENKPYNTFYYNNFTVTPRFENKMFGLYVPVSFNKLTGFNAGTTLRAGPLFIGSGSVLSALFGNSKQADVFLGIKVSGLHKKSK